MSDEPETPLPADPPDELRTAVRRMLSTCTSADELRTASSAILDRFQFMRQNGITFNGKRDSYDILGYDRLLTVRQYRDRYARGGVAGRIVDCYPKATWRDGVEIIEDDDPNTDTEFEQAIKALNDRLKLWPTLMKVDTLSRQSTYAVLLIGAPGDLSSPLPRGNGTADNIRYLSMFIGGGGPYWGATTPNRTISDVTDAMIATYAENPQEERFGLPLTYSLKRTFTVNPNELRVVHWTRVIHVAEGSLDYPMFGQPALERVWNLLDDLDKVTGGGAEAFWLRANQGIHLDIDKKMQLADATDSVAALKEQADAYANQLTRMIRTRGVNVTTLGSDVADFLNPSDAILSQIAGSVGIPKRILMGSEMGQLASGQDRDNWDTQVQDRRTSYAEPSIVRPLIDRLVEYGYLPTPGKTYRVDWPLVSNLTESEKAQGIERWSRVNQLMGETVFTNEEMRSHWYGFKPLKDSEIKAVGGGAQTVAPEGDRTPGDQQVARAASGNITVPVEVTVQPAAVNVRAAESRRVHKTFQYGLVDGQMRPTGVTEEEVPS